MSIDDPDKRRPSAVEKYAPREPEPAEEAQPETVAFYKREKTDRGPCLALTFLLRNGNRKTLEYCHRTETDFDPDVGIEMYFSIGVKVTIKGQFLGKLYDDLAEHRVLEIRSLDKLHAYREHRSDVTGKELPIVEDVIIERGVIDVDSGLWKPSPGRWNSQNQQWQPSGLLN